MLSNDRTRMLECIELHRQVLKEKGFRAEPVQDGLASWRSIMQTVHIANHCLCPDLNADIGPGNSFCWRLRELEHGGLAAMIVLRDYGEWRLADLLASGRFFWSPAEALERGPLEFEELPEAFLRVEGRIFHMGGLFVWPPYRRLDLSWHLARMIRWVGFAAFNADHSVGIELPEMATARGGQMPLHQYGYSRVAKLAASFPLDRKVGLYLTHASRGEALARLPHEMAQISSRLESHADPEEIWAAI